jgi:lipopolysaccharide biosynthesis glycosyltransferase
MPPEVVSFVLVGNDRPWAKLMVASVREHLPNARIVQMSDPDTAAIVDEVIRKPYDGRMMTFRLDHLADFPHETMLILDDDCIVKGDLSHVFGHVFDVALTLRTGPVYYEKINMTESCPYNTGVMFSRSQEFWERAAMVARNLPDRFQRWWGDQMAVGLTARRGGWIVHDLDVQRYNWSPGAATDTSDALVWHYKGKRKDWLQVAHAA